MTPEEFNYFVGTDTHNLLLMRPNVLMRGSKVYRVEVHDITGPYLNEYEIISISPMFTEVRETIAGCRFYLKMYTKDFIKKFYCNALKQDMTAALDDFNEDVIEVY